MRLLERISLQKEKPPAEKREVTISELKLILYLSFKFSQGNPVLQENLLKMIHVTHPELCLPSDPSFQAIIAQHSANMSIALQEKGEHARLDKEKEERELTPEQKRVVLDEATRQAGVLSTVFNDQKAININEVCQLAFNAMIVADSGYLMSKAGRDHSGAKSDSRSSNFMKYIKPRRTPSTGSVFYDEIFRNLHRYYKRKKWVNETFELLDQQTKSKYPIPKRIKIIEELYKHYHPSRFQRLLQRIGMIRRAKEKGKVKN